jgi:hypothetical protein
VEDHVVDLVVAVDESCAVLGLRSRVAEEGNHVVLMRDLANGNTGLGVFGGRL